MNTQVHLAQDEGDILVFMPGQEGGATLGSNKMTYVDDVIMGWVGLGSQIDGLGHLGIDSLHHNVDLLLGNVEFLFVSRDIHALVCDCFL